MHDLVQSALVVSVVVGLILSLLAWLLLVVRLGRLIGWGATLAAGLFMPPSLIVLGIVNFRKARGPTLLALFAFTLVIAALFGVYQAMTPKDHTATGAAVALGDSEFGPRGSVQLTDDGVLVVRLPSRPPGNRADQIHRIEEIVRKKAEVPVTRVDIGFCDDPPDPDDVFHRYCDKHRVNRDR